ncbi:MAG: TolC family protein, partial [Rhodospirillales bacterium]
MTLTVQFKITKHRNHFRNMSLAIGFAASACAFTALTPTVANAQSLVDALTAAYHSNPTLLARRAKLRATDEEVPQALTNWRPEVSMSVDAGYQNTHNTNSSGSGRNQTRQQQSVGINITQPLFRGGRTLASTSQAENSVRAERARLLATEQTVLLNVVSAYMNAYRDEAVLKLNLNNEQVLKRQLEATRDRFEVGEITR